MVAAARAVLVEVGRRHALGDRYLPAGDAALMEPAGEMWSVVILSPNSARMRALSMSVIGHGRFRDALEVGRVLHVGGLVVPTVGEARRRILIAAPELVAAEHVGILRFEQIARDVLDDELLDLVVRGPDVLQVDGLAVACRCASGSVARSFATVPASA